MAWVIWREERINNRSARLYFRRFVGRNGTSVWTEERADAREFESEAEAKAARARINAE